MNGSPFWPACMGGLLVLGLAVTAVPAPDAAEDASGDLDPRRAIGLIDVNYIYENYPWFKESMSEIKADQQRAEEQIKEKREELKNLVKQLQMYTAGTPEYLKLEKQINTFNAELTVSMQTQQKAFFRREATLYHNVYEEILRELEEHAKANQIVMVLRILDKPVNVAEPNQVLQQINRPVVWYDKSRDLTRTVLQRLIEKSKAAAPEEKAKRGEEAEPGDAEPAEDAEEQ